MLHALVLTVAFAVPTYGPMPAPSGSPPVPAARIPTAADEALIVNSGSTNSAGYRLRVYADGTTALQQADAAVRKHVALTLVNRGHAAVSVGLAAYSGANTSSTLPGVPPRTP